MVCAAGCVGVGVGCGVGLGVGFGVGSGVGSGVGFGVGSGVGLGEGSGVGDGLGSGVGLGSGDGDGVGVGVIVGVGSGFEPPLLPTVKSDPVAESELSSKPPESDEPIKICDYAFVPVEVVPKTFEPTAWLILSKPRRITILLLSIAPESAAPIVS